MTPCDTCNGSGRLSSDNGPAPKEWLCGDCDGEGEYDLEEIARTDAPLAARLANGGIGAWTL